MSTREAFLGLQDALRKIRHFRGTTDPGAWAGVVVFIDKVLGVVVLIFAREVGLVEGNLRVLVRGP